MSNWSTKSQRSSAIFPPKPGDIYWYYSHRILPNLGLMIKRVLFLWHFLYTMPTWTGTNILIFAIFLLTFSFHCHCLCVCMCRFGVVQIIFEMLPSTGAFFTYTHIQSFNNISLTASDIVLFIIEILVALYFILEFPIKEIREVWYMTLPSYWCGCAWCVHGWCVWCSFSKRESENMSNKHGTGSNGFSFWYPVPLPLLPSPPFSPSHLQAASSSFLACYCEYLLPPAVALPLSSSLLCGNFLYFSHLFVTLVVIRLMSLGLISTTVCTYTHIYIHTTLTPQTTLTPSHSHLLSSSSTLPSPGPQHACW